MSASFAIGFRSKVLLAMLLGVLVLGCLSTLMLSAIELQGGTSIHDQVRDNKEQVFYLKGQIEHTREIKEKRLQNRKLARDIEEIDARIERARLLCSSHKVAIESLGNKILMIDKEYKEYRSAYRDHVRTAAIGEKMDTLVTNDNKVYQRIIIKDVNDLDIRFSHSRGVAAVPFKNLSDALNERFQVSSELAASLEEERIGNSAAQAFQDQASLLKMKILELKDKESEGRQNIVDYEKKHDDYQRVASESTKKRAEHLSKASQYKSEGNKGFNYSNARKEEGKAQFYEKKASTARILEDECSDKMRTLKKDLIEWKKERLSLEKELNRLMR